MDMHDLGDASRLNRNLDPKLDQAAANLQYDLVDAATTDNGPYCGWECDPRETDVYKGRVACPAVCTLPDAERAAARKALRPARGTLAAACAGPPPPPPPPLPAAQRAHCDAPLDEIARAGYTTVIGVMSAPKNPGRRRTVRSTWFRWEQSSRVLLCFLLGGQGNPPELQAKLSAEAAKHRDILWLDNATDQGVPTLKGYEWWKTADRLAATSGSTVRFLGKSDDDIFLHVPNLERDLERLHCREHIYYGNIGWTGYIALDWRPCGWSWGKTRAPYRSRGCAKRGAHDIFPFVNGALEILTPSLVRYVAHAPGVARFVERSRIAIEARKAAGFRIGRYSTGTREPLGPRVWQQNEDVALGFWLSEARVSYGMDILYVRANQRTQNMACISKKGLYQRPRNDTIYVHFLKKPEGVTYVWKLLHDFAPHSADECTFNVWHNRCRSVEKFKSSRKYCREKGYNITVHAAAMEVRAAMTVDR